VSVGSYIYNPKHKKQRQLQHRDIVYETRLRYYTRNRNYDITILRYYDITTLRQSHLRYYDFAITILRNRTDIAIAIAFATIKPAIANDTRQRMYR